MWDGNLNASRDQEGRITGIYTCPQLRANELPQQGLGSPLSLYQSVPGRSTRVEEMAAGHSDTCWSTACCMRPECSIDDTHIVLNYL